MGQRTADSDLGKRERKFPLNDVYTLSTFDGLRVVTETGLLFP